MTEYEFTLAITGRLNEDKIDALFEAGCGDASFVGDETGPSYATFHREAPTLFEAAMSAVRQIESVEGLQVAAIDPNDLVSMPEIAQRLRRTHESVRLLIKGERGPGHFPPPVVKLRGRTRLWSWTDVAVWARFNLPQLGELPVDVGSMVVPSAINAALVLRRDEAFLSAEERKRLLELV
ncbi:MAG: hypothetical protein WAM30_01880 [Candidatus Dormiibacterota bacterium]